MGLSVERINDPERIRAIYKKEIHTLYESVVARATHRLELLPIEFFHELASEMGSDLILSLAYRGSDVIAFSWIFLSLHSCLGVISIRKVPSSAPAARVVRRSSPNSFSERP